MHFWDVIVAHFSDACSAPAGKPTPLLLLYVFLPSKWLIVYLNAVHLFPSNDVHKGLQLSLLFHHLLLSHFLLLPQIDTRVIFSLCSFSACFLCKCDLFSCFPIPLNSGLSCERSGFFWERFKGVNNFYIYDIRLLYWKYQLRSYI